MEEKKKKKHEEKTKKDAAQKKVAEQKTKVPDLAKASSPPVQSLSIPSSSSSSNNNGSQSPCSPQQIQPPQCVPRFPPREVPPRFRHHEHKQLLKRGQPLPTAAVSLTSSSACTSLPNTHTNEHLAVLPHQSGQGAQNDNSLWGIPTTNSSSSTCWDQVIIDKKDTEAWPSIHRSNNQQSLECTLDTDSSEVDSSSMSMATGASQHSHYPISKASINQPSSMVSSQGGPNRGWGPEGKTDLSMGSRSQSSWGSSNLNLNPSANPAAWPVLGHEAPGVGSGPGGMGGSSSIPSTMCGPGGVAPVHGTNGNASVGCANGNLVGDCAWGNPDTPDQHQSPTNMLESSNIKTDGPNTKAEPMSPVNSWRGTLSQSPTDQASGDGTALWGNGDAKAGESKDSAWDSGGVSSWGRGGGNSGWGEWNKQSSSDGAGWDANDGPTQEPMSSWGTDAPASEGSRDSSEGHSRGRERSSSMDFPLLPRQDLDPRVLCNSGWGQTPVRQHTVWEMDENSDIKNEGSTEAWNSSSNAPSTGSAPPPPPPPPGCVNPPRMDSGSKNAPEPSRGMPNPGWGGSVPPNSQPSTGWGEPPANKKVSNGSVGSWGEPMPDGPSTNGSSSQSWGSEEKSPSWEDGPAQAKSQGWGDGPSASSGWGNSESGNGGEWGESSERRNNGSGNSSWDGDGGNWKEPQKGWGKAAPASSGGWGDSQRTNGHVQGWGGKPQESTSGSTGSMGSWGGPNSVKQGGSGWGSAGKQVAGEEPTGWEEPSPSSIRRKMEIDDGTSTWGDPNAYRTRVNMWDRNNPASHPGNGNNGSSSSNNNNNHAGPSNNNHHHPHHSQGLNHSNGNNNGSPNQPGPPHNRIPMVNPGWGELPNVQTKSESSSWGEPPSSSPSVDNGTSAWGKPPRGSGSWGENCHESAGHYGRASAPSGPGPCKPAPKSMQDNWGSGGDEMSGMSGSQWDTEDGDMWTSPTSQDSTSSCSSWNQSKKSIQKAKVSTKQDEVWIMNRLIKQLTDMGFPRDPAEEALRSNNMNLDQAMSALLEKKSEGDKRGMGMADYSSGMNKPLVCRPPSLSKDSSLDRAPFLDKDGGLSDDTPSSPFLPSPGLKLPLTNSSLPSHGLVGVSPGLAMQNLNNRQMNGMFGSNGAAQARALQQQAPPSQPPVPPLSSAQPNLRAQVPQFLSPQVQAQLLQFAAKNIGLNPALLTSPINPQQMTLLYQLQQLQMAYQRLQIQQQMMQAQRNVSGPIRQQEQQVARTINNMQQQIQQHQRQLAQALLMKQQQQAPPAPSHGGLHPGLAKPNLDVFPGNPQAPGLSISDLQTKEPQSSPSSFNAYPLSGLNGNVGVSCMDVGGLALKDTPPQPQSRLSQWTHASSMDSLTTSTPHMETSLSKHGSAVSTHVADSKPSMEDSFSPYNLLSTSQSPSSPLVAPESWTQGKSPNEKMSNGTNLSWPPEFCPGVPWKGLQNIDPEADPNMTPGSVSGGPSINTNIQDVNRYLLRDRSGAWSPAVSQSGGQVTISEWPGAACSGSFSLPVNEQEEEGSKGKLMDMKSTWSAGPISHTQASMSHDLWKVAPGGRTSTAPSRPPPGLTNTKPSQSWTSGSLGLGQSWSSSYSSEGTAWSSDNSTRTSSWLVLRNLTPQIDGSTLRTLCMQHGPLITFHLSLPQGNALVRYSSKEEAAKAQKSLHMCVLGNTTILAEFAGEEEVTRFFAQGQAHPPNSSWQGSAAPGSNQQRIGNHWGSGGTPGTKTGANSGSGGSGNGGDLLWGGVQQYSSLWGPANGEETRVMGSPVPINTLLPGDLLSGENM